MSTPALRFGPFQLDVAQSRLTRDGAVVALRPKAFDLLATLARRPHELVTKDELLDQVWGRRFITEGVIKSIVGEVRTALGDDPKMPRWIETVPRRGYRFIGSPDAAASGEATSRPTGERAVAIEGNVPEPLADLVGREGVLDAVASSLDRHRLVTISGPSGVGKTRLALAVAAAQRGRRRDGVWFVELASMVRGATDLAALCAAFARTLRLDGASGVGTATLGAALRPLETLIVVDNAEHVVDAVARLADALLAAAPSLRILVTTQEPLHVAGEQVHRLLPLAFPDAGDAADEADGARVMASSAVRLFVERVADRLNGFVLAPAQRHAVASICRALDGMPLALELAAARVPVLGINGIAELLQGDGGDARLKLLTGGARHAVERQRALRNAIGWSHGLLDDAQRTVFRRLGVFAGGFSIEGAQFVCGDDGWATVDAVEALVDKSLVEAVDPGGQPRFRLLESLRVFALERLSEAGEEGATRARHVRAMRAHWSRADDHAPHEPTLEWTGLHAVELDNLRTALRCAEEAGDRAAVVALVASSAWFWCHAGLSTEGHAWCERARALIAEADDVASLHLARATFGLYGGAYPIDITIESADRAANDFEANGDRARAYYALSLGFQARVRLHQDFDRIAVIERMAALEEPNWNDVVRRFLRHARNYHRRLSGDASGYLDACRKEVEICRRIGAVVEGWIAMHGLMLAEHDLGDAARAIAVGQDAVDAMRAAGRLRQHPVLFALWATMLAEDGQCARARAALAELLPILQGGGRSWMAHVALGWLAAHEGRDADAVRVLGRHDELQLSAAADRPGAYIARSLEKLRARLVASMGCEAWSEAHAAGARLDDRAMEAALATSRPVDVESGKRTGPRVRRARRRDRPARIRLHGD